MFISFRAREPDAVAGHAPEVFAIGLTQVFLILVTHDVNRDAGCVCGQTDLIKLSGLAGCQPHSVVSKSNIWVGDDLAFVVLAIEEP